MTDLPPESPAWLRAYLDEYLTLDEVGARQGIPSQSPLRTRSASTRRVGDIPIADLRYDSSTKGKSRVWDAIRAASGPIPVSTVYRATGWRRLDGHGWTYVHAGGGISAAGPVALMFSCRAGFVGSTCPRL